MTPRECSDRSASGRYSRWKAIPLSHGLGMLRGSLPSWFSSSLGLSPLSLPQGRHPALRSHALTCPAPFRVRTKTAPQRFSRLRGGVISLETANPYEVSPMDQPTSSSSPRAGLLIPLGTLFRCRNRGFPLRASTTPARAQWVSL